MMNAKSQWHILYANPRNVKKLTDILLKRKIEHYYPLNQVLKSGKDNRKAVLDPLFPNYVFVNLRHEQHPVALAQLPGVINIVYWLGKPAVVSDDEICAIKKTLISHKQVKLEKIDIDVARDVKITQGTVMHKVGKVVQVRNNAVKIALPSLGYALIVQDEALATSFKSASRDVIQEPYDISASKPEVSYSFEQKKEVS